MKLSLNKIQRFTLYLYLFSLNFEIFNLMGLGSTARLTGFLYLASILPNFGTFIKTTYIKSSLQPLIIFWVFLTIISLIYTNSYSDSFLDTTLLLNILLFWILVNHERKDPGILLKGMLSFSLGSIFLTILYNAGIGIEYVSGRVSILGDNANGIAVRLSIATIVLAYITLNNSFSLKVWRFVLLLPIPTMLFFMFETGSRKAFIGFAAAFIVGTLLYKTKRIRYKIYIIAFASVVSLYFLKLLTQSEILYNRLLMTAKEGSLGGREEVWSSIIPFVKENIIWGVGKTGYEEFSIKSFRLLVSPHNVLLEVLAYTGIIGLSMYLYFVLKSNWQAYLSYRKTGFLLPLILLIPAWGMILGGQALNGKLVWAIFAFSVSTVFYSKSNFDAYSLRNR